MKKKLVTVILTLGIIIVSLSGLLMHPWKDVLVLRLMHELSGMLVLITAMIHIIQMRKTVRKGRLRNNTKE